MADRTATAIFCQEDGAKQWEDTLPFILKLYPHPWDCPSDLSFATNSLQLRAYAKWTSPDRQDAYTASANKILLAAQDDPSRGLGFIVDQLDLFL